MPANSQSPRDNLASSSDNESNIENAQQYTMKSMTINHINAGNTSSS